MWSPQEDLLAYVEQEEKGLNTLFLFDVTTGEKAPVTTTSGMLTALWSADGRFLAFGEGSRPGSAIFSSVKVLDLEGGQIFPVIQEAVAGFFWSPIGDTLLSLSIDAQRSHLCWSRHSRESREKTELVRFLPTREQTLLLSFFDQYAISHPLVSPDGNALAFAGYLLDAELLNTDSPNSSARIFVLSCDGKTTPQPVARGQFACWNLP
jgi:Tol biopolymer transport system component